MICKNKQSASKSTALECPAAKDLAKHAIQRLEVMSKEAFREQCKKAGYHPVDK